MGVVADVRSDFWRNRFLLRDAGLAVLVAATLGLVAMVMLRDNGTPSTLVTDGSPEPAPLLSPEGPLEGTLESLPSTPPSPSAVPSPTPAARPTASGTPRPVATPSPSGVTPPTPRATSASARPSTAAYPGPGLRLDVTARAAGSLVGQTTVRVRDTDGTWNGGFIAFGDGQRQDFGRTSPRCSGTSAPGDATPSDVSRTFRHTYAAAGYYDVVVYVRTERFCSNAPVEDATRTVRVRITGASSSAQPSPSPEPSEEPTPDPTPAETLGSRPR